MEKEIHRITLLTEIEHTVNVENLENEMTLMGPSLLQVER